MGVPAFYRWLREKYPKCIEDCVEEVPQEFGGVEVPINISAPNPNGVEFDNLYLDMNGIIHPCVHPEDAPAPETLDEMFEAICAYVDRLVAAVRPRQILYLAIDGVAPRAKMNQQRSRRFKAAQEMAEEEQVEEELRAALRAKGQAAPPPKKHATFDHNVITPGTAFMEALSAHLRYHVLKRQATNGGWHGLHVILSDASVPGEGEHKIMEFVRQQRAQPGYNPNTSHCLHGLDADLIMLGLATHEPHFAILREDILGKPSSKCFVCGREGHQAKQCSGFAADAAPPEAKKLATTGIAGLIQRKPLQFLHLSTLREYLDIEFRFAFGVPPPPQGLPTGLIAGNVAAGVSAALSFGYDLENAIDDFVFICFYVGNDFLPPLPSMDIREGAIDLLMGLYKVVLPALGGYLTAAGSVNLARVDGLLARVGVVEDEIFRRRRVKEERDKRRNEQQAAEAAAAKVRARVRLEAQGAPPSASAADVLELADVSKGGGGQPRQGDAALAARRVLEASVASVEAERAAAGVVPAVIHQAITAGLGARVAVVRPEPRAAASFSGAAVAPRVKGEVGSAGPSGVGGTPAVAPKSSKGMAESVNRSAAAALRAGLLQGGAGSSVPGAAVKAPEAALAAVAADAAIDVGAALAGQKRPREDSQPVPPDAGAVASAAGTDPDAIDEIDIFSAPLDASELVLLQPPQPAGAGPSDVKMLAGSLAGDATSSAAATLLDVVPATIGAADAAAMAVSAEVSASAADPTELAAEPDVIAGEAEEEEEEPPIDPSIAPGIGDMLRGAVLKTMQAKRTHAGAEDNVRLGAAGWKDRYYCAKFGPALGADARFRDSLRRHYTEGLCWVFRYYYIGVASWTWFFPYHYAPFASDLTDLASVPVKFEPGAPFPPIAQLMGVLPPRSAHALPPAVQTLMTDPASTIADFYPTRFDMDPNGKRFAWQWVVLLPFIDEARLMAALRSVESTFSAEEQRRNRTGTDLLFVHASTPLGEKLAPLLRLPPPPSASGAAALTSEAPPVPGGGVPVVTAAVVPAEPTVTVVTLRPDPDGVMQKCLSGAAMSLAEGGADKRGLVAPQLGEPYPAPWRGGERVAAVKTVTVLFLAPARRPHKCVLLSGALPPPRVLVDAEDDPSSRIPRLTRGMTVADLVQAAAGGGGGGAGGRGGMGFPPHPGLLIMQQQQQQQYGGGGSGGYRGQQQQPGLNFPFSGGYTQAPVGGAQGYQPRSYLQPPLPQQQVYGLQQQQQQQREGYDLGPAQRMIRAAVGAPPPPAAPYRGSYPAPLGGPAGGQQQVQLRPPPPYGGGGGGAAFPFGGALGGAWQPPQQQQQRFSFLPGGVRPLNPAASALPTAYAVHPGIAQQQLPAAYQAGWAVPMQPRAAGAGSYPMPYGTAGLAHSGGAPVYTAPRTASGTALPLAMPSTFPPSRF